jgi:gliding motility-associated-like protein
MYKLFLRKWKVLMVLICLITYWPLQAFTQSISNRGKDFWVSYPFNWFFENNNSQEMVLYFSSEEDAEVTLTSHLADGSTWTQTYPVAAGTVVPSANIPKSGTFDSRLFNFAYPAGNGGQGLIKKAIQIHSTKPIVAYAHYMGSFTSGAAMLLPVESWGYEYITINNRNYFQSQPSNTYFYITAAYDNTVVEITPKALSRPERDPNLPAGRAANIPYTVTLNKGQSYQYIAKNMTDDLTGSRIRSIYNNTGECHPVAVFAGTSRTSLGCTGNGTSGDFITQQCFPTQAWGSTFLTVPGSSSFGANTLVTNIYRVLVKDPTTKVLVNGAPLRFLNNNDFYEYTSSTPDYIEADKPVMVAQYFPSAGGCLGAAGHLDPEMIYLSPREQAINKVGFYRNNQEAISVNYLTLVVPNRGTGLSSLKIDGVPVTTAGLPVTSLFIAPHTQNKNYSVVIRRWVAAKAQCIVEGDSTFTAITYGLGEAESYGYNAGTYINNLGAVSSIQNILDPQRPSHLYTCVNTPVKIAALFRYKPTRIEWRLSSLAGTVSPAADVINSDPVPEASVVYRGEERFKYSLPDSYKFTTPGIHEFSIFATHPGIPKCDHTEEIKLVIEVRAKPDIDFSFKHPTGCSMDTVFLKGPESTSDAYAIRSWNWEFPGGAVAAVRDTAHLFKAGIDQPARLSVVTEDGCVSDTVKLVSIYPPPVADVAVMSGSFCTGATVSFTPSATYQGAATVKSSFWDFGNGTVQNLSNADPQSVVYTTNNEYDFKYVAKISKTCISDTVRKPIRIFSKPIVDITYPQGCLPVDGIVIFLNKTATPDAQTLVSHQWLFGDANATPGNPNASSQISPAHKYTAFGDYAITYSAETNNGCRVDTVIKATFNLKPVLIYGALDPVCENASAFSIAKGSVTNSVPGTFVYNGDGTSIDGMFNPGVAGPGIHQITCAYTTTSGCTASVYSSIEVYRLPSAAFTVSNGFCLGETLRVTPETVSAPQTWNWILGNVSASYSNSNPFIAPPATSTGDYKITLTSENGFGCKNTAIKTLQVYPLPVADFTIPEKICVPGSAVFTNKSAVSDQSTLTYEWRFSDLPTTVLTDLNPVRHFLTTGSYTVRLKATSSFGCVANSQPKEVSDFYEHPVADFMFEPKEICEGESITFTDASTPRPTISDWSWEFDGITKVNGKSSLVRKFDVAGSHTVVLMVTNNAGCSTSTAARNIAVHLLPVIDAGKSFSALAGTRIQFEAVASSAVASVVWSPDIGLSDARILRPSLTVNNDVTYYLTAVGEHNCKAVDSLTVALLRTVTIPNAFSPNNDRVHDHWEITNLSGYPGCVVKVFNRYGQIVFESKGYGTSWNGSSKGKELPMGTYYYIINLGDDSKPMTGAVTIIR